MGQESAIELIRLWVCRLLLTGNGERGLDEDVWRMNEPMCSLVRLDRNRTLSGDRAYVRKRLREVLRRSLTRLPRWPEPLSTRMAELGERLSLDAVECEVLAFMAILSRSEELNDAAEMTACVNYCGHARVAAIALERDEREVTRCLDTHSRLARAGLLRVNVKANLFRLERQSHNEKRPLPRFRLLEGLADVLTVSTDSVAHLLECYFRPMPVQNTPTLTFDFYSDEVRRIGTIVNHALAHGERGFNILIHGEPGVGKTEIVRTLAARHGWQLYAVADSDPNEQSLTGTSRFDAYRLSQFLLEGMEHGVLMFDEIEDVFDPRFTFQFGESEGGTAGKAWTNRLMESNARPVIWISNGTRTLDPAHLRRFDYILRMEPPPRDARRQLLEDALAGTDVSSQWLAERSEERDLTPARIAQIGRLAERLAAALPPGELPGVLDAQLEQHRLVQSEAAYHPPRRSNPLGIYELEYVNTEPEAGALVEGLAEEGRGTVLMYGPPGTGKTALAEYVADCLGREVHAHPASALLDKYVGETEKALAGIFRDAEKENAVLLLDEADNFLGARGQADHRWELTQTNELLMQMERFRGVFLCATNLVDVLDPAASRRFDVKLEFQPLIETQRWSLYLELARGHGLGEPGDAEPAVRARLARLDQLTPGDFAAAARGNRIIKSRVSDHDGLLRRLEAEHRMKPDAKRARPGFV